MARRRSRGGGVAEDGQLAAAFEAGSYGGLFGILAAAAAAAVAWVVVRRRGS